MTNKEKLRKRLHGLKQNKKLSKEELETLVNKKLEEKELYQSFNGLTEDEIEQAVETYQKYIAQHSFESLAEKTTLIGMIYKEIIKTRIQKFLYDEYTKKDTEESPEKHAIPLHMTDKLMELDNNILSDKEKLGMLRNKEADSFAATWNELKEKANNYYQEHGGEIYYQCPYCKEFSRQIMQIEGYDITKAAFFKHTTLYNRPLFDLYHNKIITIQQAAKVLNVHPKYITFIYEGLYLKEIKNVTKD